MLIQVKARSVGFSIQIGSMYLEGGCLFSASLSSSFYWLFNFLLFSFCYLGVCDVCSVFFSVAMFISPLTLFFFPFHRFILFSGSDSSFPCLFHYGHRQHLRLSSKWCWQVNLFFFIVTFCPTVK